MSKIERVAKSLKRFADENGLPNGVSPGELSEQWSTLQPREIGMILARRLPALNAALAPLGLQVTGYDVAANYTSTGRPGKRIQIEANEVTS